MNTQPVAILVSSLLQSAVRAHMLHLSSRTYAKHMALGGFYEAMPGLVDAYVEAMQGTPGYGVIDDYPDAAALPNEPVALMTQLYQNILAARPFLPQESHLMNLLDGIAELVVSTRYKLINLV